jgi:hypothetical protein
MEGLYKFQILDAGPTTKLAGLQGAEHVTYMYTRGDEYDERELLLSDDNDVSTPRPTLPTVTGVYIVAKQDNTFLMVNYEAETGADWNTLKPQYEKVLHSLVIE